MMATLTKRAIDCGDIRLGKRGVGWENPRPATRVSVRLRHPSGR
jgi:hypothetical protein